MDRTASRLRSISSALAVLALLWAVTVHRAKLRDAAATIDGLHEVSRRVAQEARLSGIQLPELAGRNVAGDTITIGPSSTTLRAIWFVAPSDCPRCLDTLRDWAGLRVPGVLEVAAVVNGLPYGDAAAAASHVGPDAVVMIDEHSASRHVLGLFQPSVKLLVSQDGTVLFADARSETLSCDWTFENKVRSLFNGSALGAHSSDEI